MSDQQHQQEKPTAKLPFKLPTREVLEERRKQVESTKAELHFKPKGIALEPLHGTRTSTLDSNATNSSHATRKPNAAVSTAAANSSPRKPSRSTTESHRRASREEDFGDFDDFDDLGDIPLTDDLFEEPQETTSVSTTTSTATPASTSAATTSDALGATTTSPSDATVAASTSTTPSDAAPAPPFVPRNRSTIVVNPSQRGNPLLQHIRNVPYEFGQIEPDYMVGLTSCVVFLSIRYHRLHPEYIYSRIAAIGKSFVLRVLLVLVDVDTHQQAIRELTRVAVTSEFTLICCWSNEEAARYIETYKAYENKPPDAIRERVDNDYLSKLSDCLTQVRSVNKTDVVTLSSTFGSFQSIVEASADEIGLLPGFGEQKVKRLIEAFHQPFVVDPHKRKRRRA
ncbi:Excision repair cross-complementation group 1 [Actinomortierella ambigua]|uniref:DNA excision repair protein ERCC-1 n=1 Tax=Actinomortierella ambigua TaxID=1343610 RepID=A0A9P6Q693_9FUNG|nr:Excision repair cross-complementation group 1 [Actinomortierella ambigua]